MDKHALQTVLGVYLTPVAKWNLNISDIVVLVKLF